MYVCIILVLANGRDQETLTEQHSRILGTFYYFVLSKYTSTYIRLVRQHLWYPSVRSDMGNLGHRKPPNRKKGHWLNSGLIDSQSVGRLVANEDAESSY